MVGLCRDVAVCWDEIQDSFAATGSAEEPVTAPFVDWHVDADSDSYDPTSPANVQAASPAEVERHSRALLEAQIFRLQGAVSNRAADDAVRHYAGVLQEMRARAAELAGDSQGPTEEVQAADVAPDDGTVCAAHLCGDAPPAALLDDTVLATDFDADAPRLPEATTVLPEDAGCSEARGREREADKEHQPPVGERTTSCDTSISGLTSWPSSPSMHRVLSVASTAIDLGDVPSPSHLQRAAAKSKRVWSLGSADEQQPHFDQRPTPLRVSL